MILVTSAYIQLALLAGVLGQMGNLNPYQYNVPTCTDVKTGAMYMLGQSWTDSTDCVRYDCRYNQATQKVGIEATFCMQNPALDRKSCYWVPPKMEMQFPHCCPLWRCLGGPNVKSIIQAKAPPVQLK